MVLDHLYLHADRGLRHDELLGGAAVALARHNRAEDFEVTQVHDTLRDAPRCRTDELGTITIVNYAPSYRYSSAWIWARLRHALSSPGRLRRSTDGLRGTNRV